ncbi:ATP-binding protein [Streptomyces sp. AV19]|uniref:ATP-binding protein n=1 Tax=Streptomyces sp. AV19 TaxID=2793068 RepID=UPI0018FEF36A|nr:ATP-binding protein [Streptomyces sp. AV19]MBH1939026.1 ATP-binding protein [Streptomyces sp. AV19]MDG4536933.1 ATP-binding protein [Streptomyces sp. AV19]
MNDYTIENAGTHYDAAADHADWPRAARFTERLALIESRVRDLASAGAALGNSDNSATGALAEPASMSAALAAHRAEELRTGQFLSGDESSADPLDSADRLAVLATEYGLSPLEADVLIAALLPDIDPMYSPIYRALGGTSPGMRPTVSLLLAVNGITVLQAVRSGLLANSSALVREKLIRVEGGDVPFPDCQVRVAPRAIAFLTGAPGPQDIGVGCFQPLPPRISGAPEPREESITRVAEALRDCRPAAVYLQQGIDGEALPLACAAFTACGRTTCTLDLEALLAHAPSYEEALEEVVQETRLFRAGLVAPLPGALSDEQRAGVHVLVRRLERESVPVVYYGHESAPPDTGVPMALRLDVRSESSRRERVCTAAVSGIERARRRAALGGNALCSSTAREIVRSSAARDLETLTKRVTPSVTLQDLKLSVDVRERLDMLASRVGHRDVVMGEWKLRQGGGRGWGVTALFAGDSGTGKTMAAEAVAHGLGMDLYVVSLPTVVSKYIGETERNLERIFSAADCVDAVVLFDEADSVFARRGEVKGANDRHANMQSAYLLQRLEAFGGLAILTTNLRTNIDTAFTRRFDEIIEFPKPGRAARLELWQRFLTAGAVPLSQDLDLEDVARRFDLAGGNIRSSAETAAFAALRDQRPVEMRDVLNGIELEYGKLGRLLDNAF